MEYETRLVLRAAEHFGIDENDVEPHHVDYMKELAYAKTFGGMGRPTLSYTIDESGCVVFDESSQNVLADEWEHNYGIYK